MLEVTNLSIEINGTRIVEQSSFSIPEGKITALIGESGSGKSVTVAALLGTLPRGAVVNGSALFVGRDLMGIESKEMDGIRKSRIFTIFQDAANSFNPSEKLGYQLFGLSGERKGDTLKQFKLKMSMILEELGLSPRVLKQYPFELSGGMLQRCMIACALYTEPDLLIADEPTSALDQVVQEDFIQLLIRLNKESGTTILVITHDLDVVEAVAHEMIVMQTGQIVETGSVKDVFVQPKSPYTKRLLASRF
jgi:ABC-type dipeptide/oligopeptide/nickel transport system ATPase component